MVRCYCFILREDWVNLGLCSEIHLLLNNEKEKGTCGNMLPVEGILYWILGILSLQD